MAGASTSNGRSNIRSVSSLLLRDGSWSDSDSLFPLAPESIDPEAYFTSREEYYKENHVKPPLFDGKKVDATWGKYDCLQHQSSFQYRKWKDVLSKAFQIGGDYSWRVPAPNERLYSRPGNGDIAIPVEHFKAGLRPKPHRFLVALFKQQFQCTPAQFTPNSIRLILWFIAACIRHKRQPSFEAFFTIFSVKKANCAPFYEVVQGNKKSRIGLAADGFKPVKLPNSLKNWQYEYIIMHGGDWGYMPGFSTNCEPRCVIQRNALSETIVKNCVRCLCVFKTPWVKDELFTVNRLKFYGLYPPRSMDRGEFVWGDDKAKIKDFLKAQPPKPLHLRKRVEGEVEEEGDMSGGEDDDMEDAEDDGAEAENESDLEIGLSDAEVEVQNQRLEDSVVVEEEMHVQGGRAMETETCVDNVASPHKKRRLITLGQKEQLLVRKDNSEPGARQEKGATKEWVEGESPVDWDRVFGGVIMGGDANFGEDLVGAGSSSPVLENVEAVVNNDMLGDKGKNVEENPTSNQTKENRADKNHGKGKRVLRCRPKIRVPCYKVGLKKRIGSRGMVDTTFKYIASSDDEIVDLTTGVSRRGVGYLFPTAPKQVMTKLLTRDDTEKLGGMKLTKIVKRLEKHGARFCGYGYGAALAACRERTRRKLAEKKVKELNGEKDGLIADIDILREEAEEDFFADKKRLEDQVKEAVNDGNRAREKLEAVETENDTLSKRVKLLEEQLAVVPSREDVILEYKATSVYIQDLDDAVVSFRRSAEFMRAVGAESRKMTPLVVDCCREFLRDDLHRSRESFETYFLDWVRARQRASSRRETVALP